MASWFTRALDKASWWDRGGEVQRRKKREEEQGQQSAPTQAPRQSGGLKVTQINRPAQVSVDGYEPPEPKKPTNIFEDLNKNLNFNQPNNAVNLMNEAAKPTPQPQPGQVIQPKLQVTARPQTSRIVAPQFSSLNKDEQAKHILERDLNAGKSWEDIAKNNRFDYDAVKQYSEATRPNYGVAKIERPNQSIVNRFRDVFDANTQSDKFRRQEGNALPGAEEKNITLENPGNIVGRTPVVGHITKALNTMGAQGAQLPATIEGKILTDMQASLMRDLEEAKARGDRWTANDIERKLDRLSVELDRVFREQDAGMTNFEKNSGGLFNTGTLYGEEGARAGDAETAIKDIALPTAVAMLDLYTLGKGNAITEGIKQGGVRTGIRTQVPNIAKATAGNYASGDLDARANGATGLDPVKAGLINSVLGIVPDIGLPAIANSFKSRILPKLTRGGRVGANDVVQELDDAAISASAEATIASTTPRPIPVKQISDIPISAPESLPQPINVRRTTTQAPQSLIQDVSGGEPFATPDALVQRNVSEAQAEKAFDTNKVNQPTQEAINRFEGVTPQKQETFKLDEGVVIKSQDEAVDAYAKWLKEVGEGNGVNLIDDGTNGKTRVSNNVRFGDTKGKRMTKQMWRDEAERQLRAGEADPGVQKLFDEAQDPELQSLLANGEQAPLPEGRPITVKQTRDINVKDETVVPNNAPEAPGKVQVTTQSDPAQAKTEAVAAQTPPVLPVVPKVGETLPNGKVVTKRMVASARNQRKLAKQLAKAQEETSETLSQVEKANGPRSDQGFAPTGEYKTGKRGNVYEVAKDTVEDAKGQRDVASMSNKEVLDNAQKNKAEYGGYSQKDFRDVKALFDSKRLERGTAEYNTANAIRKEIGTQAGQTLREQGYTMRRNATVDQLVSNIERRIYGMVDDPTKIDSKLFDKIEAVNETFVAARDNATKAYNDFMSNPSKANADKYVAAKNAADNADVTAKRTEYSVAKEAIKGNADVAQMRELRKLASNADVGKMDYVDSAMLSSTGTMLRNFVNSIPGAIEETIFGKPAAYLSGKINKTTVGGGYGRGTARDLGKSIKDFSNKARVMKKDSGSIFKNPIENLKTYSTLGNELGDTVIDTTARQSSESYYRKVLKEQGFKGSELNNRLKVMSMADPEDMLPTYQKIARIDAGLSGGNIAKRSKIELDIANGISDIISAGKPTALTDSVAKALTRVTIGFPSAVARATATGAKRLTVVGSIYDFAKAIKATDPLEKAMLTKQAIKQLGSGATIIPGTFYTLGQAGLITGSYPTDKAEQAEWEREGKTENSIKIGDAWYQYPAFLGAWSVPAMFWGNMGRTDGDFATSAKDMAKGITDIVPTDQLTRIKEVIDGRYDAGKFAATMGAGTVRALTPAGALLNQLAKTFDPTKNDTNTGGVVDNFIDKVMGGIPGGDRLRDIPDKTDDAGNPIKNPSVLQTMTGASSAVQKDGEERTNEMQTEVNDALSKINDTGALKDSNMRDILDDETALLYDKAASGAELKESELSSLQNKLVEGISQDGTDTAYLEREQYDTNLAALKLKKQLMEADKTVAPSKLEKIDLAIKRGEVYRDNKIPYQDISDYQDIGVEDWRKMGDESWREDGDPQPDEYDPEMYEKLWQIDQLMTKSKGSYGKSPDKNKYYLKDKKGSGSGGGKGSGQRKLGGDFGKLGSSKYAPQVQRYESIDAKSGGIPMIQTVRPNIVNKITQSR